MDLLKRVIHAVLSNDDSSFKKSKFVGLSAEQSKNHKLNIYISKVYPHNLLGELPKYIPLFEKSFEKFQLHSLVESWT